MGPGGVGRQKKVEQAEVDEDGYQVFKMPWSVNLNYSFNISEGPFASHQSSPMRYPYRYTHNLSANGNIKISNRWAISFNTGYDFEAKEIVQTTFNITRDLHCFSMTASLVAFWPLALLQLYHSGQCQYPARPQWEQRSQTQSNIQWY